MIFNDGRECVMSVLGTQKNTYILCAIVLILVNKDVLCIIIINNNQNKTTTTNKQKEVLLLLTTTRINTAIAESNPDLEHNQHEPFTFHFKFYFFPRSIILTSQ